MAFNSSLHGPNDGISRPGDGTPGVRSEVCLRCWGRGPRSIPRQRTRRPELLSLRPPSPTSPATEPGTPLETEMMTIKTLEALETPKALARDTPLSVIPSHLSRAIGAAKAVLPHWEAGPAVGQFFESPISYSSYLAADIELKNALRREWSGGHNDPRSIPDRDYLSPRATKRWARHAAGLAIAAAGEVLRAQSGGPKGDPVDWVPGQKLSRKAVRAARCVRRPHLRIRSV